MIIYPTWGLYHSNWVGFNYQLQPDSKETRDTVKLTVCVYSSCNCSTVCNATKTNSFYRLLATFSQNLYLLAQSFY